MFTAQRPSYTPASASVMSSGATVGTRTKPSFPPAGGLRRGSLAKGAGSAWRGNPQGVAETADGIDSGHCAAGLDMFRAAHTTGQPSFVTT